jgi:hypothetical protein
LPKGTLPESLEGIPFVFVQVGWLDIHYPCNGHVKCHIRISAPDKYRNSEWLEMLRAKVFRHLEIPDDETWELSSFSAAGEKVRAQHVDRNGMTDRLT